MFSRLILWLIAKINQVLVRFPFMISLLERVAKVKPEEADEAQGEADSDQ